MIVHIHCGDCGADRARAAPLPGDIRVWKDSPAVGPCAAAFAEHRRLRAQWWGVPAEVMQDPRDVPRGRPVALWFGPDPWEQLALVELLAGWPDDGPDDVTLVPLDVPTLMRRLHALEAPQHGAWYGDVVVARLRDRALA